jgi:hypothetical protein
VSHERRKAVQFPACYIEMFFYKMLQHKKCSAFVFSVLCILIQVTETADKHWNEECYSKNDCYKLLENGTKFTWPEAYDLCRKEKGYLLNDTWITVSKLSVF